VPKTAAAANNTAPMAVDFTLKLLKPLFSRP